MELDEASDVLSSAQEFEWNEEKRQSNIENHGIDFADAVAVFDQPFVLLRSDRDGEVRFLVVGTLQEREVAIVCTIREGRCRLISARRARTNEREEYHRLVNDDPDPG